MIRLTTGNLFDAPAEALVNPVNCVGVMGKGLALAFKRAYPQMFTAYAAAAKAGEVMPGRMHVWPNPEAPPKFIINFPTKRHWRSASRIEDIEAGLVDLARVAEELGLRSVAVPALGAGLGGLAWDAVHARIVDRLGSKEELEVFLYAPK